MNSSTKSFLKKFTIRGSLIALGLALFGAQPAMAGSRYWSGNGSTLGGAGTWDTTSTTNWGSAVIGPFSTIWNNANSDTAIFGGTAGTVTLGVPITVGGLQFNLTGYTIAAGSQGLNFGASASDNVYIFANGAQANVATTISGTVGGPGNVIFATLNGPTANTMTFSTSLGGWSGTTTVNAGMTLLVGQASTVLSNTSAIAINGGTIRVERVNDSIAGTQIADGAAITFNSGGSLLFRHNTAMASKTENIGAVTVASGQANFDLSNGTSSGGNSVVLTSLTRSIGSAAVTFANGGYNANQNNMLFKVTGAANTAAGEIIGPWATYGVSAASQDDYAIYTSGDGTAAGANIAASTQGTWTDSTKQYTVTNGATLGASRTMAALRAIGVAQTLDLGGFTNAIYGLLNGGTGGLTVTNGTLTTPTGGGNLFITTGNNVITSKATIADNSGAVTLVKSGNNTLTLAVNNTYTGGTVVNAGTLTIGAAGAWVSGQNLTLAGTVTVNTPAATLSGGVLTATTGAMGTILGSTPLTFTSTTGAGTIIFGGGGVGAGILDLGDASTFTGNLISSVATGTNPYPTIRFSSIADAAGSYIAFGGGQGDSGQRATIALTGDAGALTLNYRQIAILSRNAGNNGPKSAILQNNNATAANAFVINTDLQNNQDRSGAQFVLEGSNTGNNTFGGIMGNSTVGNFALNVSKSGTGRWILSGANTFTGRLIVSQGTLSVGTLNESNVAGPLGTNNVIQLGGNESAVNATGLYLGGSNTGILEYTGGAVTSTRSFFIGDATAANTGSGQIINNGSGALTFSAANFNPTITGITATRTLTLGGTYTAGANEVTGIIQNNNTAGGGLVALTKAADASTWILSGTNTYTGTSTINGGVLDAVDGTGLPTSSLLQLRGGVFQSTGTFSRVVSTAAGAVNWSSSSGGFAARGGVLNLQLNGGTGTMTWNGSSFVSTGQKLIFGSLSADNVVDFQNRLKLAASGNNNLTRTITVIDNPNSTADRARISGDIFTESTNNGIVKDGDGVLELTAANTYNGVTTVSNGTLLVNNTTGSGTGSGAVNIISGSTLGGTGAISGAVTINTGGILSPGNSIGKLTVSNLTLQSSALLVMELGATNNSDQVVATGTLSLGGLEWSQITWSTNAGFGAGNYTLINATALSGSLGSLTNGVIGGLNGYLWLDNTGKDLMLTIAIPEPSSLMLVGLGLLALLPLRRRQRH